MKTRILFSCLAAGTLAATATAQIPNGGFENWTTPPGASYQDPTGWVTFNGLTTLEGGQPSCAQGSPGAVGSYYATVTTQGSAFGVIQGIIGVGDNSTGNTGFAYASRPQAFTGQWQYDIEPGDGGMVAVLLTKWNASDDSSHTVGAAVAQVTGALGGGWHPLNVAFVYQTNENPDTAYVVVASSLNSPVAGSFIKVDDLGFGNATSGIAEQDAAVLRLYPSPASTRLNVSAGAPMNGLDIMDMTGRTVMHQGVGAADAVLNVADLDHGRYLVRVLMKNGKEYVRSFVKE
ncbi:MAG: T9SS type A sorting domain-containing protein [Bacteroidetes bacterium]|nr:T9SS type A sorting domain-containing protein [Bacteroidota bacterium]MBS1939517.1 T9SS type A sorting domain-containing protein [Bacteroidota bacterium]